MCVCLEREGERFFETSVDRKITFFWGHLGRLWAGVIGPEPEKMNRI